MSIALIFENKNPKPWQDILQEKLPNSCIEIYPNIADKEKVEFIICWKAPKGVFNEFPNAKVIQSVGASIDHITNAQKLTKKQIVTRIVDEHLSNDMWEFLLTQVLAQLKNEQQYQQQQIHKKWQQHSYRTISETSIAILGLGKIGGFVAEKFAKLGFSVKGWSNSKKEIPQVKSYNGKEELPIFLEETDFLINLLPLTDETKGILDKKLLSQLPKEAFLINVGRGEHLVEEDLLELLNTDALAGAILDVFEKEPLPKNHPFWQHPNVYITPHVASLTNIASASAQIVENYYRFQNQKELHNIVSLKKGY